MENVLKFPDHLERLAQNIRASLQRATASREAWIEAMVSAAAQIAEARQTLANDKAFGQWWDQQAFNLSTHDRAALEKMGAEPQTMRQVLTETDRSSLERIWRQYADRFARPRKPRRHANLKQGRMAQRDRPQETRAREAVRALLDAGQPIHSAQIEANIGVSHTVIEQAAAMERAIAEYKAEQQANPPVDPATLPLSARRKLEILTHRLEKEAQRSLAARHANIDIEVNRRVMAATADRLKMLDQHDAESIAERDRYRELTNKHQPIYTLPEWETLRRVTHPDNSANDALRAQAFTLINGKKLQLTGRK